MVTSYSRTVVQGRSYLDCEICSRPLAKGFGVCYLVKREGGPNIDPKAKQALCGPHYQEQFKQVYPDATVPNVPNGYLKVEDVQPLWDEVQALSPDRLGALRVDQLDPAILEKAFQEAADGDWAETLAQAYSRINNTWGTDVEVTAPVALPESIVLAEEACRNLAGVERENEALEQMLCEQLGCSREELHERLKKGE